jgi:hypothetical protein
MSTTSTLPSSWSQSSRRVTNPTLCPASWQLRFARLDSIQLHEDYRPSREEQLMTRMKQDGHLANPLIASRAGNQIFLLDGHHRLECQRKLKLTHTLVQMVDLQDPRQLRLDTWIHVALIEDMDEFVDELSSYGMVIQETSFPNAEAGVRRGQALCWLVLFDGKACRCLTIAQGEMNPVTALRVVENLYRPHRITRNDLSRGWLSQPRILFNDFPAMNLVVRFAPLNAEQINQFVAAQERIPSGITRTLLPRGRVLGVNVPLKLLSYAAEDDERQAWLSDLLRQEAMCYPGPSVIDESPSPRRYDDPLIVYDRTLQPKAIRSATSR